MDIKNIEMAKTTYLGKEVIYFKEIKSTQEFVKNKIQKGFENGTIVITDYQTQGIGTKGRKWYTSKGSNITMTMVIYPNCEIQQLEGLTLQIAETIVETIEELYQITLQIKEPNDLLLKGKKIGGILTQVSTYQNKVQYIIIGIGFNVNELNFSEEISSIATSLQLEYKREFSREEIIILFIEKFEKVLMDKEII